MYRLVPMILFVTLWIPALLFAGELIILDDLPKDYESSHKAVILDGPVNESAVPTAHRFSSPSEQKDLDSTQAENQRLQEEIDRAEAQLRENQAFGDDDEEKLKTDRTYLEGLKTKQRKMEEASQKSATE
jgi:hypothetical protein